MSYRIDGYTTVAWKKLPADIGYFCGCCRKQAAWERRTVKVGRMKASLTNTYFCEAHKPVQGLPAGTKPATKSTVERLLKAKPLPLV